MTKDEFEQHIAQQLKEKLELIISKNADYTGDSPDPFAAWDMTGEDVTTGQAIKVMIRIKENRLKALLNGHTPNHESIKDTLDDYLNYKMILIAWQHN